MGAKMKIEKDLSEKTQLFAQQKQEALSKNNSMINKYKQVMVNKKKEMMEKEKQINALKTQLVIAQKNLTAGKQKISQLQAEVAKAVSAKPVMPPQVVPTGNVNFDLMAKRLSVCANLLEQKEKIIVKLMQNEKIVKQTIAQLRKEMLTK